MSIPRQLSFFDLATHYQALSQHGDPFDAVLMFKFLSLQSLYNLSDDQTEYQIRDRLSVMRFLGLNQDQRIPDANTIWLFRETLTQVQVVEPCLTH